MIQLRKFTEQDLEEYQQWLLPHHEYHLSNGPYFKKDTVEEVENYIEKLMIEFASGSNALNHKRLISNTNNEMIGEVSWYWKSEETQWMEVGIVIFDKKNWSKGIGYMAFCIWITELFSTKNIVRIGISTWSGNFAMLKLAQKLGMTKEAHYRKARIVKGIFYDSISYGVLKEEWFKPHSTF